MDLSRSESEQLKTALAQRTAELQAAMQRYASVERELQHRVRNNLATIAGLLNLHPHQAHGDAQTPALESLRNRVLAIGLVHELLYGSGSMDQIRFDCYARQIAHQLHSSLLSSATDMQLRLSLDPVKLDISQAVPVGLILNELLSNAFRHAFPSDKPAGSVAIVLRQTNGPQVHLTVRDNGIGMPPAQSAILPGLGLKLIQLLVQQLDGSLTMANYKGTCVQVAFLAKRLR